MPHLLQLPATGRHAICLLAGTVLLAGCEQESPPPGNATPKEARPKPADSAPKAATASSAAPADTPITEPATRGPRERCPAGMKRVVGGTFLVGNLNKTYEYEENPRFQTQLPTFCAAEFEVSAAEYERCVEQGACTPSQGKNRTCNSSAKGRGEHPMNCIDHSQAKAVCEFQGGRLPSEVEWEYLARGGKEMRSFPWGEGPVDGKTCWKSHQSCKRGEFAVGAFGLHDVVGNVWEWTDSWFGSYPWPQSSGRHKVYRGGSWSRRFEKWMRPTLRNRLDPKKSGSHLGVRCVADLPGEACPYGRSEDDKSCKFGVDRVDCLDGKRWNGLRCAAQGDERRCLPGTKEVPGHGCVRERVVGKVSGELDTSSVLRSRDPEFDGDCQTNTPDRPHAYRLTGGGHLARNAVGKSHGCKNRDVGVGWNSACCP